MILAGCLQSRIIFLGPAQFAYSHLSKDPLFDPVGQGKSVPITGLGLVSEASGVSNGHYEEPGEDCRRYQVHCCMVSGLSF